jgi:hypothetical protein
MQVRKTFRKKGWRNIAGKDVTLNEVLATRRGQHFLREYLATEFSLENIYFVQAVARFEAGPTADAAEDVRATFLRPGSLLEVNISDRQKKEYGRNAPQAGPSGISRLTFCCSLARSRADSSSAGHSPRPWPLTCFKRRSPKWSSL